MKYYKYGLIGATGKMGTEIQALFNEKGHQCVFKFDLDGEWKSEEPELLIDFSTASNFSRTVDYVINYNVPLIMGTTGLTDEQKGAVRFLSKKLPIVQSYNFSIGIQLLLDCVQVIKSKVSDWDISIEEIHHQFKKDKPSGTAIMIREKIGIDVSISSLRTGDVPGTHRIKSSTPGEILLIEHQALSRKAFADGVLRSAEFLIHKKNGLYHFADVINKKDN